MDLDASPYRIFVTVADELSFTRASSLLNVSQPALSARIANLSAGWVSRCSPAQAAGSNSRPKGGCISAMRDAW